MKILVSLALALGLLSVSLPARAHASTLTLNNAWARCMADTGDSADATFRAYGRTVQYAYNYNPLYPLDPNRPPGLTPQMVNTGYYIVWIGYISTGEFVRGKWTPMRRFGLSYYCHVAGPNPGTTRTLGTWWGPGYY